jgi:hypothetical protein
MAPSNREPGGDAPHKAAGLVHEFGQGPGPAVISTVPMSLASSALFGALVTLPLNFRAGRVSIRVGPVRRVGVGSS